MGTVTPRRAATPRTAPEWGKVARSKYRAKPTVVDGFRFASQAEARRYVELLRLGDAGCLRNLELQPRFALMSNGERVGWYVGDFRYEEAMNIHGPAPTYTLHGVEWRDVLEDVKGMKTPVYRLKKKLFEAQYGIQIRETR